MISWINDQGYQKEDTKFLEVGCGNGHLLFELVRIIVSEDEFFLNFSSWQIIGKTGLQTVDWRGLFGKCHSIGRIHRERWLIESVF